MADTSAFVVRELHADLDTPVSAYLKLRELSPWSFLLESVEGPEYWAANSILGFGSRRSFIGKGGEIEVQSAYAGSTTCQTVTGRDPLDALRRAVDETAQPPMPSPSASPSPQLPPFVGGVFGYLAYDAVRSFERLPGVAGEAEVPDACFFEPELLAVFSNRRHNLTLYARDEEWLDRAVSCMRLPVPEASAPLVAAPHPTDPLPAPTALDSREDFGKAVLRAKEYIRAGDIIQVVLSRRFEMQPAGDPFDVYRGLRTINPSPYLYHLSTPHLQLAGASPEVMVRVEDGGMIVRPIAGTRGRGENAARDRALAAELLADPKERAEHIMLVDLGRNDVGRVCKPGSVQVAELMGIETYSHVMHIVSEVRGQLSAENDAFDALRAAFPAGTLSGAPKVRAMEIIDELEGRRRGVYGGAVGYFGPSGNADFGIAIRTLIALPDAWVIQAGAGIVADSHPELEADETEHKARAVVRATQWAASAHAAR